MSKGILEFNLPEDASDFRLAQNAWKYKATLENLSNAFRAKVKYNDDPRLISWQEARDLFNDILTSEECPDLFTED